MADEENNDHQVPLESALVSGLRAHKERLLKEVGAINVLLRIHGADQPLHRLCIDTALKHLSKLPVGSEFGAKDIRECLKGTSLSSVSVILSKLEGLGVSKFVRLKGRGQTSGKIYRWLGSPAGVEKTKTDA